MSRPRILIHLHVYTYIYIYVFVILYIGPALASLWLLPRGPQVPLGGRLGVCGAPLDVSGVRWRMPDRLGEPGGLLVAKMKRHRSGAEAAQSRRTGAPLLRCFCAAFVVRYAALLECFFGKTPSRFHHLSCRIGVRSIPDA